MVYKQNSEYHLKPVKDLNLSLEPSRSLSGSISRLLLGKPRQRKMSLAMTDYSVDNGLNRRKTRSWHSWVMLSTSILVALPILFWSFDSPSAFYEPPANDLNISSTDDLQKVSLSPQNENFLANSTIIEDVLAEEALSFTEDFETVAPTFLDEDAFFDAETAELTEFYEPDDPWQTLVVQKGDSLSLLFERHDLSSRDMHNMLDVAKEHKKSLLRLRPGQKIQVKRGANRHAEELVIRAGFSEKLRIYANQADYVKEIITLKPTIEVAVAHGTIRSSLYASFRKAGLSRSLMKDMIKVFRYDIDFSHIKAGDKFSVVYEKQVIGNNSRDGDILAVKFVHKGEAFRAVRYTDETGYTDYYTAEGNSLQKSFLRAPLKYTRISSGFNRARLHPILRKVRPHLGVDFAAPKGTPIYAAGDGVIEFVGRKSGYGKTIVVKHNFGDYSTLYAHLSGFQEGLKKGQRVRQGHTIGFVGSTGLSTGNHLHYEFRVKGVHKDPLTVKLPKSTPLPKKYKAKFMAETRDIVAQLDGKTNLAANSTY